MHVEHCHSLSCVPASPASHEQDGERLCIAATCGTRQRLAILLIGDASLALFARGDPYRLLLVAGGFSPPDQISERVIAFASGETRRAKNAPRAK
jgi:hypothetical protein